MGDSSRACERGGASGLHTTKNFPCAFFGCSDTAGVKSWLNGHLVQFKGQVAPALAQSRSTCNEVGPKVAPPAADPRKREARPASANMGVADPSKWATRARIELKVAIPRRRRFLLSTDRQSPFCRVADMTAVGVLGDDFSGPPACWFAQLAALLRAMLLSAGACASLRPERLRSTVIRPCRAPSVPFSDHRQIVNRRDIASCSTRGFVGAASAMPPVKEEFIQLANELADAAAAITTQVT